MTGLLLAVLGGLGVFYLYTSLALGWTGLQPGPTATSGRNDRVDRVDQWLIQAGLDGVDVRQFLAAIVALFLFGAAIGFAIFGGIVPAFILGGFAGTIPVASYRVRRRRRLDKAHEAWPHMIEEIRILTGSAGRSVPQALFDVGRRAPEELRPAFDAAHREWLLTTDFDQTLRVLKARMADPTADVTCETLLIAHQLGGTDLDQRLGALAEDRVTDTQGRKDAVARQAGARFARWFTIIVPIGMALVGMSIGNGRSAYQTGYGQVMVVAALVITMGCWAWATRIMRLPQEQRVFPESASRS